MTFVKICGIRNETTANEAVVAGADAIGFMFAPSRRQISVAEAAVLRASLHTQGSAIAAVGVFVDPPRDDVAAIVEHGLIDTVQLSGDESPVDFEGFPAPIIKAIPAGADDSLEALEREIDHWSFAKYILLDARVPNARGGTGRRANWELATLLAERYPVLLAGGLDPANVRQAIATVKPAGVDVSSGVEQDGIKDPALIRAFVQAAKG